MLCIEANLNEIPSVALEQELEELKQFEGMDLLVDLLPDDLIRDMSSDMTYRKIYNYEPDLVTRRWLYLIGFAVGFWSFQYTEPGICGQRQEIRCPGSYMYF